MIGASRNFFYSTSRYMAICVRTIPEAEKAKNVDYRWSLKEPNFLYSKYSFSVERERHPKSIVVGANITTENRFVPVLYLQAVHLTLHVVAADNSVVAWFVDSTWRSMGEEQEMNQWHLNSQKKPLYCLSRCKTNVKNVHLIGWTSTCSRNCTAV